MTSQRAAIEYALPPGRFEWRFQGWFNPEYLELPLGASLYLLYLLRGTDLSIAARIRNVDGALLPGLVIRNADGSLTSRNADTEIQIGAWRQWRVELLRLATRETTAILYLDENGRATEQARLNGDMEGVEPTRLRAGIGFSSPGVRARVMLDEFWITETELLV